MTEPNVFFVHLDRCAFRVVAHVSVLNIVSFFCLCHDSLVDLPLRGRHALLFNILANLSDLVLDFDRAQSLFLNN